MMKVKLFIMGLLVLSAVGACKKETTDPGTNPPANTNTDAREKFVASYGLRSQCTVSGQSSAKDFVLSVEKGTANNAIVLKNFMGDGYTIDATVNNDNITIPAQDEEYFGDPVTISGTGKLTGTKLSYTWMMVAKSGHWQASCTDSGDKK